MGNWNQKKYFAIKSKHDKEFSNIPTTSGIYLWTREKPEINKTTFYVGQAIDLRARHFNYYSIMSGLSYPTKHFEASLKAHNDWKYTIIEQCDESKLNEREKYWIDYYSKQDNFISYNTMLTTTDRTTSNKKRIDKIENKIKSTLRHSLSKLNIDLSDSQLHIYVKENKDGSFNKASVDAFNDLKIFIKEIKIN